ncbi:zinc-dependent metalloprotease family protein [Kribbella sp. C-35]|uniref:zinc-dependent metalloprotease family protein n=1 Tax=Kribbella sp. C-35 TaxID=2789276 RepID=UPI003978610F
MRPRPALFAVLTSLAAAALAASSAVAAPFPHADTEKRVVAATDTDGDSLPDTWETNGYDANGDGVVDVDLPGMGANPKKKDLFVEMDYMAGRLTTTAGLDRIVQVFASAPVSNPDGSTGIKIHLDAGSARGTAYNLGGGNEVAYDADLNPSATQTNAIKAANFASARKAVFHYMLWGDSYDGGCSSGQAFNIPNDTFIVTVGPKCNWNATDDTNVGTFIHELGHNIGLKHGGTDNLNYKPNYLSVMNYSFQLGGVLKADGTKYWGYSSVQPTSINEARPDETVGLGSLGAGYRTSWKCPNGSTKTTAGAANQPIDWNCDGDTTDTTTAADINGDKTTSILIAQNNWANIVFGGGAVGGGSQLQSKTPSAELQELTHDEWTEMQHR